MSTTEAPGLAAVKDWAEETYQLEIYEYSDHIRLTNGSGGHYVDIHLGDNGESFHLKGKRWSESIDKTCDRDLDTLESVMSATL